jgi:hypothetical protein
MHDKQRPELQAGIELFVVEEDCDFEDYCKKAAHIVPVLPMCTSTHASLPPASIHPLPSLNQATDMEVEKI